MRSLAVKFVKATLRNLVFLNVAFTNLSQGFAGPSRQTDFALLLKGTGPGRSRAQF